MGKKSDAAILERPTLPHINLTSVADPDHFDADPDPTSEKSMMRIRIRIRPNYADPCGSGSDHALYKIS
jgi:hypothetical protein